MNYNISENKRFGALLSLGLIVGCMLFISNASFQTQVYG